MNLLNLCSDSSSQKYLYDYSQNLLELNQLGKSFYRFEKIHPDTLYATDYYKSYFYLLLKLDKLNVFTLSKLNFEDSQKVDSIKVFNTIGVLNNPKFNAEGLPFSVQKAHKNYDFFMKKKAAIAMSLSIVVPGLGKTYLGEKLKGLPVFISCLALGLVSAEALLKDGADSPRFIVSAGIFSALYASNIYVSYKLVFKKRRDTRKQLIYELENFYIPDFRRNVLY